MSNLREDNKINKSKKLKNFVFFNRDYTAGDYKLTKKEKILISRKLYLISPKEITII